METRHSLYVQVKRNGVSTKGHRNPHHFLKWIFWGKLWFDGLCRFFGCIYNTYANSWPKSYQNLPTWKTPATQAIFLGQYVMRWPSRNCRQCGQWKLFGYQYAMVIGQLKDPAFVIAFGAGKTNKYSMCSKRTEIVEFNAHCGSTVNK